MQRRDLSKALLVSSTAPVLLAAHAAEAAQTAKAGKPAKAAQPPANFPNYPITSAEAAVGAKPEQPQYPASPYVDPRRYGAVGDGKTDDTEAMQTALNVALAGNGRVIIPDSFDALCGPLSLILKGNRDNQAFTLEGVSVNSSKITLQGKADALLTIAAPAPSSSPSEVQLVLRNFTLEQPRNARTADGIFLHGIGGFRISNVQVRGFNRGVYLLSSLVGQIDENSFLYQNNYGLYCRTDGKVVSCNLVTCRDSRMSNNVRWGIDYDGGTLFSIHGCAIEENGTATDYSTGGLAIRSNVSGILGFALLSLEGVWFERNQGQTMLVEELLGNTFISVANTQFLSEDAGHSLLVKGCSKLTIRNSWGPSPKATWDLTAGQALLESSACSTLVDKGVAHPTYINFSTSTSSYTGVWVNRKAVS